MSAAPPPRSRWTTLRPAWQPKLRWFAAEIAVVVLGVLIAFQVDAWGKVLADRAIEAQSLRELRSGLTNDLADIRVNVGYHGKGAASARLLRAYLRDRRPYSDTLDAHFGQVLIATYSVRDLTAYETLKQRGLNTVTNDSLRAAIGHLYGVAYPNFSGFQQLEEKLVWQPQGVQPRGGRP